MIVRDGAARSDAPGGSGSPSAPRRRTRAFLSARAAGRPPRPGSPATSPEPGQDEHHDDRDAGGRDRGADPPRHRAHRAGRAPGRTPRGASSSRSSARSATTARSSPRCSSRASPASRRSSRSSSRTSSSRPTSAAPTHAGRGRRPAHRRRRLRPDRRALRGRVARADARPRRAPARRPAPPLLRGGRVQAAHLALRLLGPRQAGAGDPGRGARGDRACRSSPS